MRLAQLARRLKVKPTDIINFVSDTFDYKVNSTPNSIIPKEYLSAIVENFALGTPVKLEAKEKTNTSNVEPVRAEKVMIPGVKVVGKIDLPEQPEPKEKTKEETKEETEVVQKSQHTKATVSRKTSRKPSKRAKKEISYEEQKQLEHKKHLENIKRKKEKEKKKRKAHYEAMMKERRGNKKSKKKATKVKQAQIQQKVKEEENKPTSLWGKFIYWLNN